MAMMLLASAAVLSGCSNIPPAISSAADDPSNPSAPESVTRPLRPGLVDGATTYLSSKAGAGAHPMKHGAAVTTETGEK